MWCRSNSSNRVEPRAVAAKTVHHALSDQFSKDYPLQILVAEDYPANQKLALNILSKLGYQAHLAQNGAEVMDLVKRRFYDVILMDVQMPEVNGLEATIRIRQQPGPSTDHHCNDGQRHGRRPRSVFARRDGRLHRQTNCD